MQKAIEKDNKELDTETSFVMNAKNAIMNIINPSKEVSERK